MKNKKKKKVLDDNKRKRILFKKNKRKIIELKSSKKIKEILSEKIKSGLEKEIEEINVPRFKDILKATEPKRERVAENQINLEQELASAPTSEKEEGEKIDYSPKPEDSTYLSETPRRERANDIEYPLSPNLSEISTRTVSLKPLHDFREGVNETTVRKEEFLDPMRGNVTNTRANREKTFDAFDKKYIDNKFKEKEYKEFKQ